VEFSKRLSQSLYAISFNQQMIMIGKETIGMRFKVAFSDGLEQGNRKVRHAIGRLAHDLPVKVVCSRDCEETGRSIIEVGKFVGWKTVFHARIQGFPLLLTRELPPPVHDHELNSRP
jgi:hypothetical protein